MKSFLLTPKMAPELRERVLQSLHSDARARVGGSNLRKGKHWSRLAILVSATVVTFFLVSSYQKARAEFTAAKADLIARYERRTRVYDQRYVDRLEAIEARLLSANGPYVGDFVLPTLTAEGGRGLEERLAEPLIYVRGPLRGFLNQQRLRTQVAESRPDALIRCLILPPESPKESSLLRHLGGVYQPAALRGRFVNLDKARAAVAFVQGGFEERLHASSTMRALQVRKAELRNAPLEDGRNFLEAKTFFLVLDEAKTKGTVTDFDGEAEHYVRLLWVDLTNDEVLFRQRRQVSPEWISDKSRLAYSRELDSCRLAYDLREGVFAVQ